MPLLAENPSKLPSSRLPLVPPAAMCHTHLPSSPSIIWHPITCSCLHLDILLWSVIVPALALEIFTRTLNTTLHQTPAVATQPRLPSLANVQTTQLLLPRCLTTLMLSAVCSAATLPAPSWYLQGGRSQLLAAAHLLHKVQLLLPATHALRELQWVWTQTGMFGGQGVLAVIIWPAMLPVSATTGVDSAAAPAQPPQGVSLHVHNGS
jgi:hypothetical protein